MYKIFTLAAVIAIIPVARHNLPASFNNADHEITVPYFLIFKNTATANPFQPVKKSTEAWSQNWMAMAQENIRKSEYHFKWEEKLKAYCTSNRKNNLRFFYTDKGFSVEPRTTKIPIGEFDPMARPGEIKYLPTGQAGKTIPNWKVKFNLDKKQVGKGKWQIVNNKAEYITEKITVQYINNDEGMRQNFIVYSPLSKDNELKINFNVKTNLRTHLSNDQLKFFHKKNNVLNYDQLKVWDATGRSLQASFKKQNNKKICIQVDTKNAVYPITIDPISTTPAALLESNQPNAQLGFSVASAGDVNGDGYSDVIAGAPGYDGGLTDEGAAFIFHGLATGVSTIAAAIVESNVVGARMGISVSTAGDVNGDRFSDIVVGANTYSNSETWEGAVYIYHGSSTGINTTAAIMMESNQLQAQMGYSVACAGDVNSDGYSDIIVGAWLYDNSETNEGVAFVYHGSNTGISSTIATTLEANQSASNFGIAVAGAGDVNGDGFSDVIVGAENYNSGQTEEGVVFIYHGSNTGINNVAITMSESNQGFSQFGFSVSSAGDVNGDGYSDVIVGAYTFDNLQINEGAAFIYHGSPGGINNIAADTLESNLVNVQFGVSVACAGDINGDGYSDLIVGASNYDNIETDEGAAYVYFGSTSGINIAAVTILESNQANAQMGRGVASAGDVNGDGYSDVIVGAFQYNNVENDEGVAFVYHGSPNGLSSIQTRILNPANQDMAGIANAVAGAGDVNGDGYSDVIIGAFGFDDGFADEGRAWVYYGHATGLSATPDVILDDANQANANFGYSVATAGDVNGDGYSDVIVGARLYDGPGNTDEGRAWVHYGSAGGLSVAADRILDDANQTEAEFGFWVSAAGDVNGDGYSDVIVGARFYNGDFTDEGQAFVYHGSAGGLSATPASVLDDANQLNAFFGVGVAGAGDVNGDGYSDVVVSAPGYDDGPGFDDEGVAFIYFGSTTGLSVTPDQILDDANAGGVGFGFRVAGAGDVNGDGFADVVVTSIIYDGLKGRGWVYYGHAITGLSSIPDVILDNSSSSSPDRMGYGVSSAGDVNGDGYSDVIIGLPQRSVMFPEDGQANIYYGSAAGLSATPAMLLQDATETHEFFGLAVACAGDINGDGYSDVIVGADHGSWASPVGGRAYVHNGNDSISNRRNYLRIYNADLNTPINNNNFIFGNFGAGLYAKSFLGRDSGKLVWETRLNYNAYSGIPITNSTFFTAQQSSYTDMGLTGVELKNLIAKINGGRYTKLRARIKYDPVTAITGQVYSPWRNVSSIIDANNFGALPIELISFKAAWMQKGKTARLDFTTDKESGICCFDIEQSANGFNFYSIGTLPAKNVSGQQSYSFIDNNATGKKQFYRLKIKGIAGQVDYSNIQQLQYNTATEFLVFPNPTTDVLQLQLNNVFDKMNVRIINSSGQLVKQMQLTTTNQTFTIPVQNLAAGKYWLHLQSGNDKQVLQFVKQ